MNIPPNIWRPKLKDKFRPTIQYSDINNYLYSYPQCGKTIKRTVLWKESTRTDIEARDDDKYQNL